MKRIVLILLIIIGYLILSYSDVAALEEDIPRPELVKIANEELIRKGLHDQDYFSEVRNMAGKTLFSNKNLEGIKKMIVYWDTPGKFFQKRILFFGFNMEKDPISNFFF